MDLLQFGLILLIIFLIISLSVTGVQVFLVLKDMRNMLNRLNESFLPQGKVTPHTIEKREANETASSVVIKVPQQSKKGASFTRPRFFRRSS